MASQIPGYLIVCWGAEQRTHQSSASLASVRGIHRWPMNSPHKGPVTRKMFPFEDVIMEIGRVFEILWVVLTAETQPRPSCIVSSWFWKNKQNHVHRKRNNHLVTMFFSMIIQVLFDWEAQRNVEILSMSQVVTVFISNESVLLFGECFSSVTNKSTVSVYNATYQLL